MEKISLIIPTRIRPKMMENVWTSAKETAYEPNNLEICFYIDDDDELSINKIKEMCKDDERVKYVVGKRICLSKTWNEAQKLSTGTIFWHGNDDCIFRSKDWDKKIIDEFKKYEDRLVLVYGKDGIWDGKSVSIKGWKLDYPIATAGFVHQKWIDTIGYFLPPYFSNDYNDVWLSEVFHKTNRMKFLDDIYIEHLHYTVGKMEIDQNTLDRLERGKADKVSQLYKKLHHKRLEDIEKIKSAIKST